MRKPVDIALGSINRSVAVTIGHAVTIEGATGLGVIALTEKFRSMSGTLTEAATIISVALDGQYTVAQVLDAAYDAGGIVKLQTTAVDILSRLFVPAKGAPKKASKADPLAVTP